MADEKKFRRNEIMSEDELDNVVGGAPQFQTFGANDANKIPDFIQKLYPEAVAARNNFKTGAIR